MTVVLVFSCKSLGRRFAAPHHVLLPIFHLERVHVLYDACDLQHTAFTLRKLDDKQYFLGKVPLRETNGDICLSRCQRG
jgi:hypothetical protein